MDDSKYVALARAIAQQESKGNHKIYGDNNTSYGLGQWNNLGKPLKPGELPAVWKEHANMILGDSNAEMSLDNQKTVLTGMVKKWATVDKLQPYQIAAKWNSGSGTGWENKVGTSTVNGKALKYDVPGYVKAVDGYYKQYKPKGPVDNGISQSNLDNGTGIRVEPTTPNTPDEPGFFRGVAISAVKDFENMSNVATTYGGAAVSAGLGNVLGDNNRTYADYVQGNKDFIQSPNYNAPSKFLLGDNSGQNVRDMSTLEGVKQFAGDTLSVGTNFVGGGAAVNVVKGVAKKSIPTVRKLVGTGSALGAAGGFSGSLQDNSGVFDTILNTVIGAGVGTTLGAAAPVLRKGLSMISPEIKNAVINSDVMNRFTRAIKPSVSGKNTAAATEKYNEKAFSALVAMKNNPELKFITEAGEEVGRNPQTLAELNQAIPQTMEKVFNEYNNLTKQAGKQQSFVDVVGRVTPELDLLISNKALNFTHPEVVTYSKAVKERLAELGQVTPEVAQNIIKNYNEDLAKYYNGNGKSSSQLSVDAMVSNHFRESLDSAIEKATGKEYQALKNTYGALKTIAKDVNRRSNVFNRLQPQGLIDYTDILSAGDIVSGVATMNPLLIAKAGAQYGIKELYKHLNSPNRAVKKMFSSLDDYQNLKTKSPNISNNINDSIPAILPPATPKVNPLPVDNRPLRDILMQRAASDSKLNANPVYTKYTQGSQLPTIDMGTKSAAKSNLPKQSPAQQAVKDGLTEEQYIKGQGKPILHFTKSQNVGSIEKSGLRSALKSDDKITDGISLATKRTEANTIFGDAEIQVYINPKAKSITLKEALDKMGFADETDVGVIKNVERQAPAWARENGFDVLDMREARGAVYKGMDEIRVLNPDVIKTTAQLRTEYADELAKSKGANLPTIRSLAGLGLAGSAATTLNNSEAATSPNANERAVLDNKDYKDNMIAKTNPLYSAYDTEISTAEKLVKEKFGITLPKGYLKTIISQESSFGKDDTNYNPSLGENAWLVGLTDVAKKEISSRMRGDYAIDPTIVDPDTIQGAINAAALYTALRAQVSEGADAKGNRIINKVLLSGFLSNPVMLYTKKYNANAIDNPSAKVNFKRKYEYISR